MRSISFARAGAVVLASVAVAAAAACSSSSTTTAKTTAPVIRREVIAASLTGPAALKVLNSQNAPLTFPVGYFGGLVVTTQTPFPLGGSKAVTATTTFHTLAGNLTVTHTDSKGYGSNVSSPNTPPPTKWTQHGKQCYFTAIFDKGTFFPVPGPGTTGKFAVVTGGTGTFTVIASGKSPLLAGKTVCSFNNTGPATQGTINFAADGRFHVKS